jgi:predicted transcriptional regulator
MNNNINSQSKFAQQNSFSNEKKTQTIFRFHHNREHPYVQINRQTIFDSRLSPKAFTLLIKCLSLPADWHFNLENIAQKFDVGMKFIYKAVNELISYGYVIRLSHHKKGKGSRFDGQIVEYVFFEVPATEEEKERVSEEFKKRLGVSKKESLQKQKLDSGGAQYIHTKEREYKKPEPDKVGPGVASLAARHISSFFYDKLLEMNPTILKPNLDKWAKEIGNLITVDKREPESIKRVIEFIAEQHRSVGPGEFKWSLSINSPSKLKKHFSNLWASMNEFNSVSEKKKREQKLAMPEINEKVINENREFAKKISKVYEGKLVENFSIHVDSNAVQFRIKNRYGCLGYAESGFQQLLLDVVMKFLKRKEE